MTPLVTIFSAIESIVSKVTPYAMVTVLALFAWYLIIFVVKGRKSKEARDSALHIMGYAILALFIIVAIWGVIEFIRNIIVP
jgi:cytochrome b